MLRKSVTLAVAAAAFWTVPAFAQQVELSPYVGAVVPFSNVLEEEDPTLGSTELKHKVGIALGGRVTLWTPGSLGFEGQFAYALSNVKLTVDGTEVEDCGEACDASIVFGAAKVMFRFAPPAGGASFHIGGGPAVISRSGNAYEGAEGTTDIGGVVNLGVSFKVGPVVSVRVDAEDYLSSAKFGAEGAESESKFQNDVVLAAGVQIGVGP